MARRGRPRKYPKEQISEIETLKDLTSRGAQNIFLGSFAMNKIVDCCSEATQRFFLGGRTYKEIVAGKSKRFCVRKLVMQELGRQTSEEIAEIADSIANNQTFATWTQQEIVYYLRYLRLSQS